MKRAESIELLDAVWHKFCKKGLPINVKKGFNMDAADYIRDIVGECIQIDEPIGTTEAYGYETCPKCNGIVGMTGYYCRFCGAMLRYNPNGEKI